jgi:chromosome partitioning protein
MSKIIAISNHKGGVGKTTSAISLGAALSGMGKRVLLVDFDPQANLTQSLGLQKESGDIYQAIKSGKPTIHLYRGMDIITSSLDLSGAEIELSGQPGREFILKELLEPIRKDYHFILIDTPPGLGLLTINAFTASQEVLIPVQAEFLATQGLAKLREIIDLVKKRLNPGLTIGGVFITRYDSRKILNRNVAETIKSSFPEPVFNTRIRDNIALAEGPAKGLDIFSYDRKSQGAEDYLALAKEIVGIKIKK